MATTDELRGRLKEKLYELFQLNQPDLDFGFYRVMHMKAAEVQNFIDNDLLKIASGAFANTNKQDEMRLQKEYEKSVQDAEAYGVQDPHTTSPVQEAKARWEKAKDSAAGEADVYDHLYRFFERYYDDGDFVSLRYYARETLDRAAPYAIPYNGEEVKLHWANADQYYIKSAEYFSNFTFDLLKADEVINKKKDDILLADGDNNSPLKVHFCVVEAAEGEHGNIKETDDAKRFFILHGNNPLIFNDDEDLVVNFEYRPDPTKTKKDDAWRKDLNEKAVQAILLQLEKIAKSKDKNKARAQRYLSYLEIPAPIDKNKTRPLLARYVNRYTGRNTMDYFIHKDLGGFLHRELDFYIKNEVMRLDDISDESVNAPAVEDYLKKLKILRDIGSKLIDFLAQLENYQKKIWLKKKFVLQTDYCITLDRVPQELYDTIVKNKAQIAEWVKLFAINQITNEKINFSTPLKKEFLKSHDKLVLDTKFFDEEFKAKLLASIDQFDDQCDGLLIHSENLQALNLLQNRYFGELDIVHIDPPYNTDTSGFLYKNSYKHSSWLSMMLDRILFSTYLMNKKASFFQCHIDENEYERLFSIVSSIGMENYGTIVWDKRNPLGGTQKIANQHEYILCYAFGNEKLISKKENAKFMQRYLEKLIKKYGLTDEVRKKYHVWIKNNQKLSGGERAFREIDRDGKIYQTMHMGAPEQRKDAKYFIPLIHPKTKKPCPVPKRGWSNTPEFMAGLIEQNLIHWGKDETVQPRRISYLDEMEYGEFASLLQSGSRGKTETDNMGIEFSYCHPTDIYNKLIFSIPNTAAKIIDYFAGSGTTGHSVINLNREDGGKRKYVLVEMGRHFDTTLKPRIQKIIYSDDWKEGKPVKRDAGISHCFKYMRLESYEDALNNLEFDNNIDRSKALELHPELKRDYMLRYMLEAETKGSASLLNIDKFKDPTSYTLSVKKTNSDEYVDQNIDLIETFNYLIGLRLTRLFAPESFDANFERKKDKELPQYQNTKLTIKGNIRLKPKGQWWFRMIEGMLPKDPSNPNGKEEVKVLIIWRKLTGDLEKDNLMLDEWFRKQDIGQLGGEFSAIYVNGSNNLANIRLDDENWKLVLIEEEFQKCMWDTKE